MKTYVPQSFRTLLPLIASIALLCVASAEDKKPNYDSAGRFHLYSKAAPAGAMPFIPYGFMPTEAAQMIQMDTEYKIKPNPEEGEKAGEGACIKVAITWAKPYWGGVGFFSGPGEPPYWWGDDDRGNHYDFSGLKKKKLVFYARGETGKERIQVKFGILGDRKYGDSSGLAAATKWLKLTPEWQRFELPLDKYKPSDLSKIANAFTFVAEKIQQDNAGDTVFYLDTITLE